VTPKVLLFDFGGTLDADGVAWKERYSAHFAAEGAVIPPVRFDPAFYASCDVLVGAVPERLPLAGVVERVAGGVGERLGIDPSLSRRAGGRFLAESRASLASSRALLARLARMYRLGVVSNFYGNLAHVLEEAGFGPLVSAVADSAVVGAMKPDARIFRAALEPLGAAPEEALFVGDSLPRDMSGARALGMPHVFLSPVPGAAACCPGDRVIRRLADLPVVLGGEAAA
jgi:putative hydrolase of the HAD superfamily